MRKSHCIAKCKVSVHRGTRSDIRKWVDVVCSLPEIQNYRRSTIQDEWLSMHKKKRDHSLVEPEFPAEGMQGAYRRHCAPLAFALCPSGLD